MRLSILSALLFVLIALPACTHAQDNDFHSWLSNYRNNAAEAGVKSDTINRVFADIEFIPDVIVKDRSQPEFTLSFADYSKRSLTPERVQTGRSKMQANNSYLKHVEQEYGVPKSVIVALWGIETGFGRNTGKYDIMSALATLAYDGRRSEYFGKEFIAALKIIDTYPYLEQPLLGSWAGAMGQCQFMPTTYLSFAVDGDGDGQADLWHSTKDVFASAANYLSKSGWKRGERWGDRVTLSQPVDQELLGLNTQKTFSEWAELGVKNASGKALPKSQAVASLVVPDGPDGPAYLVYDNYRVIMKWNRSHNFALTVGTLSDRIAAHPTVRKPKQS